MTRSLSLAAALAVGFSLPALAVERTQTDGAATPAYQSLFTEVQARQHLLHLGYTDVSGLTKDQNGNWVGTATTKDGQKRAVAVDLKGPATRPSATN